MPTPATQPRHNLCARGFLMLKPNTNEALSSELDFASSYKTERPLRRNGLIESAFVTTNNRSLNFQAQLMPTPATQPRHLCARGFFYRRLTVSCSKANDRR